MTSRSIALVAAAALAMTTVAGCAAKAPVKAAPSAGCPEVQAAVREAEARCPVCAKPEAGALERTQAELKQARDERRRAEEKLALVQTALEQAETELIRSKARLKGIETKAEAASAIAEARTLLRRLGARTTAVTLCQQSIAKAEQQLAAENYGAAMFFALKAQDIASHALATPARP